MDVISLALSVLALIASGATAWVADKRTTAALEMSRRAEASAVWSPIQDAVQRLIGLDPAREDVGERLANLRIAGIALADDLGWEGLDGWLRIERGLGASYARAVMEASASSQTPEERMESSAPYWDWADRLGHNLRVFRKRGNDPEQLESLREGAVAQFKALHEQHGWPLPPSTRPGEITLGD